MLSLILCLLVLCCAFSVSLRNVSEEHPFDSKPMLDKYYDSSDDGNLAEWDKFEISLLTVSQGGPIYSWFGHAAFLVTTPDGREITFDYGNFSFNDEDFIKNFVMGRLWFLCYSTYARTQIAELEVDGRSVTRVDLPFTAEQKKAVIEFLDQNVQRENREYLYHHYKDNCATRLRDIIDRTTDGDFKRWAQAQEGYTYRQEASRALSRNRIVQWGLDFLQSSNIDKDCTLWDAMFLPDVLEAAVMEYYGLSNELILDNGGMYKPIPDEPQSNILFSALAGLILGGISALLMVLGWRGVRGIYCGVVDILFGILGSVLLFMMCFTNHDVTWMNENILFVNPLLIVLGIFSFIPKRWFRNVSLICYRILCGIILALALLKLVLHGVFDQANWNVMLTMLLVYLPNCFPSKVKGQ